MRIHTYISWHILFNQYGINHVMSPRRAGARILFPFSFLFLFLVLVIFTFAFASLVASSTAPASAERASSSCLPRDSRRASRVDTRDSAARRASCTACVLHTIRYDTIRYGVTINGSFEKKSGKL